MLFSSSYLFICGIVVFSFMCIYINVENFILVRDEKGNVFLEDGKGCCFFDLNFKFMVLVVDGEFYIGIVSSF